MVRGLYQSSASMQYLVEKTDVIGNNLANASTSGFKNQGVFFRELIGAEQALENNQIHNRVTSDGEQFTMQNSTGCYKDAGDAWQPTGTIGTYTDTTSGPLQPTGNPLDLALSGDGYFVVQTSSGNAYTRDGQFKLDKNGFMVTANGDRVLGEGGPIQINGTNVSVSEDGDVSVDGTVVNRISRKTFDSQDMKEIRDGLYTLSDDTPTSNSTASVQQGFLEGSNVNIVHEMVDMITAQRHYDANARLIQTIDSSLQKSVNEIGRI